DSAVASSSVSHPGTQSEPLVSNPPATPGPVTVTDSEGTSPVTAKTFWDAFGVLPSQYVVFDRAPDANYPDGTTYIDLGNGSVNTSVGPHLLHYRTSISQLALALRDGTNGIVGNNGVYRTFTPGIGWTLSPDGATLYFDDG